MIVECRVIRQVRDKLEEIGTNGLMTESDECLVGSETCGTWCGLFWVPVSEETIEAVISDINHRVMVQGANTRSIY